MSCSCLVFIIAPSRGGGLLLGETRSAELTLGDPCYFKALALRTRTPGARALLPATRSRSSGPLGALLSSLALDVRLMTALQVLQVLQVSLTADRLDTGANWRVLVLSQAHHRSRLSDSVKNGNALRTVHNAALPAC